MENITDWALLAFGVVITIAYSAKTGIETWQRWQDADFDGKVILIEQLVQAAEQSLGPRGEKLPGAARKEWVMQEFAKYFPNADIGQLRILIEAAVGRQNSNRPVVFLQDASKIDDAGGAYWMGSGRQN